MKRHNEIASLMGRLCDGENVQDILVATGVLLANVISKSYDDEDAKEAAVECFVEVLRSSVEDLDEGHGIKSRWGCSDEHRKNRSPLDPTVWWVIPVLCFPVRPVSA